MYHSCRAEGDLLTAFASAPILKIVGTSFARNCLVFVAKSHRMPLCPKRRQLPWSLRLYVSPSTHTSIWHPDDNVQLSAEKKLLADYIMKHIGAQNNVMVDDLVVNTSHHSRE